MRVIRSIRQMSIISSKLRQRGKSIGLVPTMGALHHGHLSLIRKARTDNDIVAVSIFVNPAQFSPYEDFSRYPRPRLKDLGLCQKVGVDFVFCPDTGKMYPAGFQTYVSVERLSKFLCGRFRPRHFRGVTTVVAKLFNIVQPDIAYFGQKDAQQAVIIKKMTEDLNFPLKIMVLPIVREKDGLAMSSRNLYLSRQERQDALVLLEGLKLAQGLIRRGETDSAKIVTRIKHLIKAKKTARIDYCAVVNAGSLVSVKKISANSLIALAVYIGKTRLIDNLIINA